MRNVSTIAVLEIIREGLVPQDAMRLSQTLREFGQGGERQENGWILGLRSRLSAFVDEVTPESVDRIHEIVGSRVQMNRTRFVDVLEETLTQGGLGTIDQSIIHTIHQRGFGAMRVLQIDELERHGLDSSEAFATMKVESVRELDFEGYPSPAKFFSEVLGRNIRNITREVLLEAGDVLDFLRMSPEEQMAKFIQILDEKGFKTPWEVRTAERKGFQDDSYGDLGMGRSFYYAVTGEAVYSSLTEPHLWKLSEKLDFPFRSDEEIKAFYRQMLIDLGYVTQEHLSYANKRKFAKEPIGHLKSGRRFLHVVTGENADKHFSGEHLAQISEQLDLPHITREQIVCIIQEKGYETRYDFKGIDAQSFFSVPIEFFGSMRALYYFATGKPRKCMNLGRKHLEEMLDALKFPYLLPEDE